MKNVRTTATAIVIFILATVLGCASGPGSNAAQRGAHKDLEKGDCPSFIAFPGERSEFGRQRYGAAEADANLASYRDRELANCESKLAAGDAAALRVLVEYWYVQKSPRNIASAYKTYLKKGSDVAVLAEASVNLYKMYSTGEQGLPPNQAAAFHYLGLAVRYDAHEFELLYADALHARGLYADAYPYYLAAVDETKPAKNARDKSVGKQQLCEANLRLADMYFRGRGVKENWYVGYYYWLQGLSMAGDPNWGSCTRDSFIYRDRYAFESERKRAIDRRLGHLGRGETARVKGAWEAPQSKGLAYIAALDFSRPALSVSDNAPVSPVPGRRASQPSLSAGSANWRPWAPLSGGICRWQAADRALSWSEVFQLRSGAIWTLNSVVGNTRSVGSAVAVSPTKLLTNCHLIQAPSAVTLLKGGRSLHAAVVAADRKGDRCILQTGETLPVYVTAARRQSGVMIGEDVAAIGNPKSLDTSLSRGIVAQKRDKNGRAYIQTDAAISSGSSGGGLFDTAGNLVGITTFKVAAGESLNFAMAIDEFCRR